MGTEIIQHGVDAEAYADFVAYTINTLNPANTEIGVNFRDTLANTTDAVNLFILIAVFILLFILALLIYHAGHISAVSFVSIIAAALVIITLFYALSTTYTLSTATDALPRFQQALVKSFLYVINAGIRSTVYLTVCE